MEKTKENLRYCVLDILQRYNESLGEACIRDLTAWVAVEMELTHAEGFGKGKLVGEWTRELGVEHKK